MSRTRATLGAGWVLLALSLAACGEGDDEPTPANETTERAASTTSTTMTSTTSTSPTTTDDTGGIVVPDAGHEGGGPDPGTNEGGLNSEPDGETGATGEGSSPREDGGGDDDAGSSGGQSAPEQFEEFCEENPAACE